MQFTDNILISQYSYTYINNSQMYFINRRNILQLKQPKTYVQHNAFNGVKHLSISINLAKVQTYSDFSYFESMKYGVVH